MLCHLSAGSTGPQLPAATGDVVSLDTDCIVFLVNLCLRGNLLH